MVTQSCLGVKNLNGYIVNAGKFVPPGGLYALSLTKRTSGGRASGIHLDRVSRSG